MFLYFNTWLLQLRYICTNKQTHYIQRVLWKVRGRLMGVGAWNADRIKTNSEKEKEFLKYWKKRVREKWSNGFYPMKKPLKTKLYSKQNLFSSWEPFCLQTLTTKTISLEKFKFDFPFYFFKLIVQFSSWLIKNQKITEVHK